MLICEFNGIPGSGKTTICNNIIKLLREENVSVASRIDIYKDFYKERKLKIWFEIITSLSCWSIYFRILKMSLFYGIKSDRLKWTRGLILLNHIMTKAKLQSFCDILILDEGIVQYLTSIPHDKELVLNTNEIKLIDLISDKHKLICINTEIDKETAMKRIRGRNEQSNHRFSEQNETKLMLLLECKEKNLVSVRTTYRFNRILKLDMNKPTDYNSIQFINMVKGYLGGQIK